MKGRNDLAEHKQPYAQDHAPIGDFPAAVRALKPTAIIGVAAVGGAFTREVLEEMAHNNVRPIVFALSNPDFESRMHRGAGVSLDRRTRAVRERQPV